MSRPRLGDLVLVGLTVPALLVAATRGFHEPRGIEIEDLEPPSAVAALRVHVDGAVAAPGVIVARSGDRVADAIARAGGAAPDADLASLNLARRVADEERVVVPRTGERAQPLVDLNRAGPKELEALPGIGPALARRIVEARGARPFASSDELVERGVISERVYLRVRDLVGTPP